MRILVADDDRLTRHLLQASLRRWGHEVVETADGPTTWDAMQKPDAPCLSIVDWMMPGLDGVEICRRARRSGHARPVYIILLTVRTGPADVAEALEAGADDYVTKPFDGEELRARVGVGVRVVQLQLELAARIAELEQALRRVDELHGILPICAYCKKVRTDTDSWQKIEDYVSAHSTARFSHGVCPGCRDTILRPELEELKRRNMSS